MILKDKLSEAIRENKEAYQLVISYEMIFVKTKTKYLSESIDELTPKEIAKLLKELDSHRKIIAWCQRRLDEYLKMYKI